jgi:phosphoglycolate phosphatase
MQPQLLIFDLDGTLIDSRRDLATAVNLMRQHFGLAPLPTDAVTGFVGNGVRMLVSRALEGTAIDIDEALRVQKPFYLAHLADETTLYAGVDDGLRRLRAAGHVLAVATNKPAEATELILRHFRIRDLFANVLGGGSAPHLKPDADMILASMRATAMGRDDTWVIGDNYTDFESARRAGVRSICAAWGFGQLGGEQPTLTLSSFDALAKLFTEGDPRP